MVVADLDREQAEATAESARQHAGKEGAFALAIDIRERASIPFDPGASDEQLSALLADFYARRALTRKAIHPEDCARAILFLAGPQARCTTGHLLPVDGGLVDAFLR